MPTPRRRTRHGPEWISLDSTTLGLCAISWPQATTASATREDALDQLEEARDVVLLHSAKYQQSLRRYQARRVRGRDLKVGDLVLRLAQSNKGRHKLTPPWEGPYIIAQVLKPGTYKLANEKGEILTNAWNIEQLRRFYP